MNHWLKESPDELCDQHLLGLHVELHMAVGCIRRGRSLQGYIDNGLISVASIRSRHQMVVHEMKWRGMNHRSPLPPYDVRGYDLTDNGYLAPTAEFRCQKCKQRRNHQ